MENKFIIIIAGPNGAGKTTFAREYLPFELGCIEFINADLIAEGLSPFRPEEAAIKAGRIMINEIHDRLHHESSFAFETTLSGLRYKRLIPQWQSQGYLIKLVFLRLPNPGFAINRVALRVQQGGHNVPEGVIRRRFNLGWANFNNIYKHIVNAWVLYDNSGNTPILVDAGENT